MAGLIAYPYEHLYKPGWQKVKNLEDLNAVRAVSRRTIVLYTLEPVLASMNPPLAATLKRDFRMLHKFPGTLGHGTVYVRVAEGPGAVATSGPAAPGGSF
jgi:hypothetical protein